MRSRHTFLYRQKKCGRVLDLIKMPAVFRRRFLIPQDFLQKETHGMDRAYMVLYRFQHLTAYSSHMITAAAPLLYMITAALQLLYA